MTRFRVLALTGVILALCAGVAPGEEYYVSLGGDDGAEGTSPERAWRTIGKLNATSFVPGDTVHLRRGDVFAGVLVLDADDSGSRQQPVIFRDYGNPDDPLPVVIAPGTPSRNDSWTRDDTYPNLYYRRSNNPQGVFQSDRAPGYYSALVEFESLRAYSDAGQPAGSWIWLPFDDDGPSRLFIHPWSNSDPNTDGITYYLAEFEATIRVDGAQNLRFERLHWAGSELGLMMRQDGANTPGRVAIDACIASGHYQGLTLAGHHVTISRSEFRYNGDHIGSDASQLAVTGNAFREVVPVPEADREAIGIGSDQRVIRDLLIEDNDITGGTWGVLIIARGHRSVTGVTIRRNRFFGQNLKRGIGLNQESGSSGQFRERILVCDNVFDLDWGSDGEDWGIQITDDPKTPEPTIRDEALVYNNTVVGCRFGFVCVDSDFVRVPVELANTRFVNNYVAESLEGVKVAGTINSEIDYNRYHEVVHWIDGELTFRRFRGWSQRYDGNGGRLRTDPLCLEPAYRPRSLSGLDATGSWRPELEDDFYGVFHRVPPSVGAAEAGPCADRRGDQAERDP